MSTHFDSNLDTSLDLPALRAQFPILEQQAHGKPLVYLDNAATTQKPLAVIEAMDRYYREQNANVHRASHYLSAAATTAFEEARMTVAKFINADIAQGGAGVAQGRTPEATRLESIVWTRGATEAINLVAQSWGRANLTADDEIILTELEHHANIVPWQLLAADIGFTIKVLPILPSGELDMAQLPSLLCTKTKLLSVCHVSNALGIINPVEDIIAQAHAVGAKVLIDGAQAVAHLPIDVQALDCDFYVFSGHKLFGPTGIGVLYGKPDLLDSMPPWQGGGEMIEQVSFSGTRFQPAPFKFEAGTPPIAEAIGLAAAIQFLHNANTTELTAHEQDLLSYATEQLRNIDGLRIIGDVSSKISVISFVIEGLHQKDIASALDHQGIALRSGHHCTMPLMHALKLEGTLRLSLSIYNSRDEIDRCVQALRNCVESDTSLSQEVATGALALLRQQTSWDARYRQLMLLGKAAPASYPHREGLRCAQHLITGCESKAWLAYDWDEQSQTFTFYADSDAKIIRGLLALILDIYNHKTAREVLDTDLASIIEELGLWQQLSPSRGNGLRAIVQQIHKVATEHVNQT